LNYTETELGRTERMQYIRKTVNGPLAQQNTLCLLCRTVDKTDVDWISRIREIAKARGDVTFGAYGPVVFDKIVL
jgi:hypothetical protein